MKIAIVSSRATHHSAHAGAMRDGLARHGIAASIIPSNTVTDADVVVCWGWRKGKTYREQGRDVLVMERGYLGDRFAWTSLGWNGLNGRASWPEPQDGGARFLRRFANLRRPWRERPGGYALIIGQVLGDAALDGVDMLRWYLDARAAMRRRGYDVLFRPHPESFRKGHNIGPLAHLAAGGTLDDALSGAAVVVTWNSNTGVDATLAGIPAITCDDGAMARPVTANGLDAALVMPDRSDWLHRMAWRQWSLDEIASGAAWDAIKDIR
ncbi:hypothetical protein [Bosea minatitlanensis]|uniref:Capsule polysaccharide biosynthesis protein n=1 Tax=Bosea minatitlanensis TaxID=128782 RepID=A0ABW0F299_9HYPH|nr:hypothetical protein [Bosea minatitlanensis]MCT4492707.1 hypothetical protein [Bosea minatitlanensis]